MKGEVLTEIGTSSTGKYWIGTFVVELENRKEATDLAPEIMEAITAIVKRKVRHGIHIVRLQDDHASQDRPPH